MAKIISKSYVETFLEELAGHDVYVPVEEDGVVRFRLLEDSALLDFANSRKPPKEVFFPQTEKMFDFDLERARVTGVKDALPEVKPIVLFGVRPCDARAMVVLDALFSWDYIDPYYKARRDNSTIISFGCTQDFMPMASCFCTSVGGNPCSTEGADMLWTDIGESYLVEALTDKGERMLELGPKFFNDATETDVKAAAGAKKRAEEAIVRNLETDGVVKALEATFDSPYWKEFSDRCLGCGICTLLCPTCHCFDINDVMAKGQAWRERTWDSCQYSYYTIHASGHNPRPEKKHRQRNRIYHKFLYSEKNLDLLGCVGCGRCIMGCPVNIDIVEVVEGAKGVEE